jgi:hypothetical protein
MTVYGTGQDQIDQFFESKRSWSRVKDRIVKDYVSMYLNTVHKLNRRIVLVDAFSGPGSSVTEKMAHLYSSARRSTRLGSAKGGR